MKKGFVFPLCLLGFLLVFSLWCSVSMRQHTERWRAQLQQADTAAAIENWPQAEKLLAESYQDWRYYQTYLHVLAKHDQVDDAETMYRRANAFAVTQELSEFRAELADLDAQLDLLAETERFTLHNIL